MQIRMGCIVFLLPVAVVACIQAKSADDRPDASTRLQIDGGSTDGGHGFVDAAQPTPAASFGATSAAGATRSVRYRARISIGAPVPVGVAQGQRFRTAIGTGSLAPFEPRSEN